LETLDELAQERANLVSRAEQRAAADSIQERVVRIADKFAVWTEVVPVMFNDLMDDELEKYTPLINELDGNNARVEKLLEQVKVKCRYLAAVST
jgi:programmed cell death 6-interacting protein